MGVNFVKINWRATPERVSTITITVGRAKYDHLCCYLLGTMLGQVRLCRQTHRSKVVPFHSTPWLSTLTGTVIGCNCGRCLGLHYLQRTFSEAIETAAKSKALNVCCHIVCKIVMRHAASSTNLCVSRQHSLDGCNASTAQGHLMFRMSR